MSNDAAGSLQELSGAATTFTRVGVASGNLLELTGLSETAATLYCTAAGNLKKITGNAEFYPSGKGSLQALTGTSQVLFENRINANGYLLELSGDSRSIVQTKGIGTGLLKEITGNSSMFANQCCNK